MQSVADLWAPIPPHGLVQLQNDCLPTLIFKAISLAGKAARLFEVLGKDVDGLGSTPKSESLDNGSPTTTTEFGAVAFPTELVLMRAALERFVYNLPVTYQEPLHFVQGGIPKLGLADGRGLDAGAIVLHSVIYATYQLGAFFPCFRPPTVLTRGPCCRFSVRRGGKLQPEPSSWLARRRSVRCGPHPTDQRHRLCVPSPLSFSKVVPLTFVRIRFFSQSDNSTCTWLCVAPTLGLRLVASMRLTCFLLLPAHQAVWTLTSRTLLREITKLRKAGAGPSSTLLLPSGLGSFGR